MWKIYPSEAEDEDPIPLPNGLHLRPSISFNPGATSNHYYYLICGRMVLSLYNFLIQQILKDQLSLDLYAPFNMESSSLKLCQVDALVTAAGEQQLGARGL